MRKLMIVALFILSMLPLINANAASSVADNQEKTVYNGNHRLLAAGAGAIIGIVTFNMLTYPFGSVPFVAAPLDPTPVDIALGSRVFATLVAGTSALIAHYLSSVDGDPQ